ncbi:MAG: glycine cleavage system protein GcvH [Planctomycetota bacterium]
MDRYYTESHEWASVDGDQVVIGLSQHAAEEIGEIIHVELPKVGDAVTRGQPMAEIESVKSVNDFYAPVDGTVAAVNEELEGQPELANQDPLGKGWFVRVTPSSGEPTAGLLTTADYEARIAEG